MRRTNGPTGRIVRTGGLALALGVAAGCETSPTAPGPITGLPRDLTAPEVRTIEASNEFGFRLFGDLYARRPDENLFVSPLSAHMALGMALNGADGNTFEAMRATLGFASADLPEINGAYAGLIALLGSLDPAVEIRIGNSAWYRDGYPILAPFLDALRLHFGAEAAGLDFADPASSARINDWVRDATQGKIDRIVGSLPGNVVLILLNAIYFKGDWSSPFDPELTHDAPFHRPDGTSETVKMMSRRDEVLYRATESFDAVELPYGGAAFRMTILLPRPEASLVDLIAGLTPITWESWFADLRPADILLEMPRFKVEWEKSLNETLQALGMGVAFEPGTADFGRMTPESVWIDQVKQKTFVRVNEEGTEAAAVTKIVFVDSAPPTVRLDRPFLFVIRERFSGTLLFMGAIVNPESE